MPHDTLASPLILTPPADLLQQQPGLKSLAAQLAMAYVYHEMVTEQALQRVGAALWRALGADSALQIAARTGISPGVSQRARPFSAFAVRPGLRRILLRERNRGVRTESTGAAVLILLVRQYPDTLERLKSLQ